MAAVFLSTLLCAIPGRAENLKLLISVEQQNIVAPNPVRATLHFHNSGQQSLWLYRPVLSKMPGDRFGPLLQGLGGETPGQAHGGSQLEVRIVPQNAAESEDKEGAGSGFAMAPDAFPFPRLVRLGPDEDYNEKVSIHIAPAQTKTGTGNQPVWGPYRFSVIYSADYSNADALARNIGANLWHGQTASNTVTLELRPPASQGSIAGTAVDSFGRPYGEALVTLSDNDENPLDQMYTDDEGRFSFKHLPMGQYWLTVRQPGADHDTSVFRHIEVSQAGSPATVEIMMLPVRISKGERLRHKPVLFHIVDNQGHPLADVKLAILYSAQNVVENLKAQTGKDGFAAISLIPGTNLLTLQMAGCRKEDRRTDVEPGEGVDGFKFVYDCVRK